MVKIHPIEKCMQCGKKLNPLLKTNKEGLADVRKIVDNFYKDCEENPVKYPCLSFASGHSVQDPVSEVSYFLCGKCCTEIISYVLQKMAMFQRSILYYNFSKIKEGLK